MTNSKLGTSTYSGVGFLGSDKRSIRMISTQDQKLLRKLGITRKTLVTALKKAMTKAQSAFGAEIKVKKGVIAVEQSSRGILPCPLCDHRTAKGEIILSKPESGLKLSLTPLSLHLIEKHAFFQGKGSVYRVDPKVAVDLLGLKSRSRGVSK